MILGSGRRRKIGENGEESVETWVEWVQRTTRQAEELQEKYGLTDWLTIHRQRKIKWAEQLAVEDRNTWAGRLAEWQPDPNRHSRPRGRPRRRWDDDLREWREE